jgi:hypothetical protein
VAREDDLLDAPLRARAEPYMRLDQTARRLLRARENAWR